MNGKTELIQFLEELEIVQTNFGVRFYFVGGCVRDAFFGMPSTDIDIVVEGDIRKVISYFNARYTMTLSQFNTAFVEIGWYHIDLAEARKEIYHDSTGLPSVARGTIEADLIRRDFTINTGYVNVSSESIDHILIQNKLTKEMLAYAHPNFLEDIEHKVLRVLHQNSFNEDATRMLRAVKYQVLHQLTLDRKTEELFNLGISLKWFNHCSEDRYRKILVGFARHQNWDDLLRRIYQYGIYQRDVSKAILDVDVTIRKLKDFERNVGTFDQGIVLLLLIYENEITYWSGAPRQISSHLKHCLRIIEQFDLGVSDEQAYRLFLKASNETIAFFYLCQERYQKIKGFASRFLDGLSNIKLCINGKDLREMGIFESEQVGKMLKALLEYELDINKNLSKKEELDWVERRIHEYRN